MKMQQALEEVEADRHHEEQLILQEVNELETARGRTAGRAGCKVC